jgi:uncharacterized SAM-dependent methyltransferase
MLNTTFENLVNLDETNQRFLTDTINFWSGKETGHLNAYAFNEPNPYISNDPVRGGEHWTNMISRHLAYYLITKEAEVVEELAPLIGSYLPEGLASGDLGPGEEKAQRSKTLPLNQFLRNSVAFAGVDVNSVFSKTAAELVEKETGIPAKAIVGDFLSEDLNIFPEQRAVFSLFGGLLCNFGRDVSKPAEDILKETFNSLAKNFKVGDYLVITQDTNDIKESLLKAYSHPDMALYILSVLHKMKRDLPTENFDPDAFEFVPRWNEEEHLLSLNIRLKENRNPQSFKINGNAFTIGHGREFSIVNSYKFPPDFFVKAAEAAGFVSEKLFELDGNPIATHIFQYKPRAYSEALGIKVA